MNGMLTNGPGKGLWKSLVRAKSALSDLKIKPQVRLSLNGYDAENGI